MVCVELKLNWIGETHMKRKTRHIPEFFFAIKIQLTLEAINILLQLGHIGFEGLETLGIWSESL
jgi:hypothetical protein